MKNEDFDKMVDEVFDKCKAILVDRAKVYAKEDRFHNFKRRQTILRADSPTVISLVDFTKHFQAFMDKLSDFPERHHYYSMDKYDENIIDMINYLLLMRGMIIEVKERGVV